MDNYFGCHDKGYLMANGDFKETLNYGDKVKIYYNDNTETKTTYLGYFRMPDDSVAINHLTSLVIKAILLTVSILIIDGYLLINYL
jgi:hypothetical protein